MSRYKIEIYESADGSHRFRIKAGNGETVASSEGYTRKESAERGAKALVSGLAAMPSNPSMEYLDTHTQGYITIPLVQPKAIDDARNWLTNYRPDISAETRETMAELIASIANFAGWVPVAPVEMESRMRKEIAIGLSDVKMGDTIRAVRNLGGMTEERTAKVVFVSPEGAFYLNSKSGYEPIFVKPSSAYPVEIYLLHRPEVQS